LAKKLHPGNAFCIRTEMADIDMSEYMKKYHGYNNPVVMLREKYDYRKRLATNTHVK
jgi:hypothetical protein